jgi:chemotaxis protein histidine kinase CheA
MSDAEVIRLRRLRDAALRARAIASALNSHPERRSARLSEYTLGCWRIARATTGRLRNHPYLSYQQGPSGLRVAYERMSARLRSGVARYRGRRLQLLSVELQRLMRELDDTRALTRCTDLSDTLGRLQGPIRKLEKELNAGVPNESRSHRDPLHTGVGSRADNADNLAENWPYLAF